MRRNKLIVLVSIIFTLSLTAIFSHAEQDEERRVGIFPNRNIKIHEYNFRLPNNQFNRRDFPWPDMISLKEYQNPNASDEISVRFTGPVTEFDIANLMDKFQPKNIEDLHDRWEITWTSEPGVYHIRIPENKNAEQVAQIFERSPYVERAIPVSNDIYRFTMTTRDYDASIHMKLDPFRSELTEEVYGADTFYGIESAPETDSPGRFPEVLENEDLMPADIQDETGQSLLKNQPSDNKASFRSKAKIHTYRDSEGRLVITNYNRYKNINNKQ